MDSNLHPDSRQEGMKQGESIMNYRIIDKETYYRKGVYRHFTEDCRCSTSMTARIDVTALAAYSRQAGKQASRHQILSQLSVYPVEHGNQKRTIPWRILPEPSGTVCRGA